MKCPSCGSKHWHRLTEALGQPWSAACEDCGTFFSLPPVQMMREAFAVCRQALTKAEACDECHFGDGAPCAAACPYRERKLAAFKAARTAMRRAEGKP